MGRLPRWWWREASRAKSNHPTRVEPSGLSATRARHNWCALSAASTAICLQRKESYSGAVLTPFVCKRWRVRQVQEGRRWHSGNATWVEAESRRVTHVVYGTETRRTRAVATRLPFAFNHHLFSHSLVSPSSPLLRSRASAHALLCSCRCWDCLIRLSSPRHRVRAFLNLTPAKAPASVSPSNDFYTVQSSEQPSSVRSFVHILPSPYAPKSSHLYFLPHVNPAFPPLHLPLDLIQIITYPAFVPPHPTRLMHCIPDPRAL
ncbi:hypothetical protein PENSPDRAFT_115560 [Peniophora sp. CONT]|nr:hypothetical protein PENSPDRAFT_115560 [Peniophora sp. CONT]